MSEDQNQIDTEARGLTVQPVRQAPRLISASDIAIWDTASFEHMGRVGALMADSGLMSETFVKDVERSAVVARCVMVANLARECGANPLMFLQGCSIISRKLHLEGKLVNAIIRARTGVNLKFRFGVWDTDHIEFPPMIEATSGDGSPMTHPETGEVLFIADPKFFHGVEKRLAIHAFDPADPERFVEGSVAQWETTRTGSPWSSAANYRRQLRYRAAPEWARAFEPGAVLGIYSDADQDEGDFQPVTTGRAKRDLKGKLTGAGHGGEHGAEGFDRNHVASETGESTTAAAQASTIQAGDGDDAVDTEVEEIDRTEETAGKADEATKPENKADDPQALADRLQPLADEFARISPQDEPVDLIMTRLEAATVAGETVSGGHAEPGEKYVIAGEIANDAGKRLTYVDGVRFSAIASAAAGKLKAYAIHGPLKVETEEEGPTETGGAQAADSEPATSETATNASDAGAGQAEVSGQLGQPAGEMEAGADPPGFLAKLRPMTTWKDIKAAFVEMNRTTDWVGASPVEQDEVRRHVWAEVERVRADHDDKVDQAGDISAFGLWLATRSVNRDGADEVEGTFRALKTAATGEDVSPFDRLSPASKATITARVDAFLKLARGQ